PGATGAARFWSGPPVRLVLAVIGEEDFTGEDQTEPNPVRIEGRREIPAAADAGEPAGSVAERVGPLETAVGLEGAAEELDEAGAVGRGEYLLSDDLRAVHQGEAHAVVHAEVQAVPVRGEPQERAQGGGVSLGDRAGRLGPERDGVIGRGHGRRSPGG